LVVVDGLVIDLTDYKWEHPGGSKLLEQYRGRDVSYFFRGSRTHSNYAVKIVESLAIAKLSTPTVQDMYII
jgi:cytochrome b involved in lipid metabolism